MQDRFPSFGTQPAAGREATPNLSSKAAQRAYLSGVPSYALVIDTVVTLAFWLTSIALYSMDERYYKWTAPVYLRTAGNDGVGSVGWHWRIYLSLIIVTTINFVSNLLLWFQPQLAPDIDRTTTQGESKVRPAAFLTDAAFLSVTAVAWALLAGIVQVDGVSGDLGLAIALIVGHFLYILTASPWEDVVKSGGTTTEAMWLGTINLIVLVLLIISPIMSFSAGGPDWMTSASLAAVILTVVYLFATFGLNLYYTLMYPTESSTSTPVSFSSVMNKYAKAWLGAHDEESAEPLAATAAAVQVKRYKKSQDATSLSRSWMSTNRFTTVAAKAAILVCLFITPSYSLDQVEKVVVQRLTGECLSNVAPYDWRAAKESRSCALNGQICKDVGLSKEEYEDMKSAADSNRLCGITGAKYLSYSHSSEASEHCETLSRYVSACVWESRVAIGKANPVYSKKMMDVTLEHMGGCCADTTSCAYYNMYTEKEEYDSLGSYVKVGVGRELTDNDIFGTSGYTADSVIAVVVTDPSDLETKDLFSKIAGKEVNTHKRSDDYHCSSALVRFGSADEPACIGKAGQGWKNSQNAFTATIKSLPLRNGSSDTAPILESEGAMARFSYGNATLLARAVDAFEHAIWYFNNVDQATTPLTMVASNVVLALANIGLNAVCNALAPVASDHKIWGNFKSNLGCTRSVRETSASDVPPGDLYLLKVPGDVKPWVKPT